MRAALDRADARGSPRPAGDDADLPARIARLTDRGRALRGARRRRRPTSCAPGPPPTPPAAPPRSAPPTAGFDDVLEAAGGPARPPAGSPRSTGSSTSTTARLVGRCATGSPSRSSPTSAPRPDVDGAGASGAPPRPGSARTRSPSSTGARRCAGGARRAGRRGHRRRGRARPSGAPGPTRSTALADLVNGRGANTLRMRLQSFVLAARLEQVAEVASRRLQDMSGGRYTFLHSDAQGRHGARGGLGPRRARRVHRRLRGRPRRSPAARASWPRWRSRSGWPTSSPPRPAACRSTRCSSTRASARSTPQALDAVMTVLDELRRGGRTVGVISHLEELRTRIPTRIEVIAGRRRLPAGRLSRQRHRRGASACRCRDPGDGCRCAGPGGVAVRPAAGRRPSDGVVLTRGVRGRLSRPSARSCRIIASVTVRSRGRTASRRTGAAAPAAVSAEVRREDDRAHERRVGCAVGDDDQPRFSWTR